MGILSSRCVLFHWGTRIDQLLSVDGATHLANESRIERVAELVYEARVSSGIVAGDVAATNPNHHRRLCVIRGSTISVRIRFTLPKI
ncbi:MAG: hypothetical protein K2X93_16710 [Candidatus Obscuribacterales bacterium]|nr:hypothetical protein [Candidatus Obscuribacterales bacterium]